MYTAQIEEICTQLRSRKYVHSLDLGNMYTAARSRKYVHSLDRGNMYTA